MLRWQTARPRRSTAALIGLLRPAWVAEAPEWPSRPITWVVPFAAGGPGN